MSTPRAPKGWRRLSIGASVRVGDKQHDNEHRWTTLTARHVRFGPVMRHEIIIRKVKESK